ncbi:MAG: hypothetical protein RLZ98_588 [Pseudomonadota bacterium]
MRRRPQNATKARATKRKATTHPRAARGTVAGNRSVVVAVDVLKALASLSGPAALGQIALTANMSASRTHRYLSGLTQTGLVEQNAATGHYSLGPTAVELGLIALGQTDAVKLGNELLPHLSAETGLVSLLSTWGSYGPTIVKWERGDRETAVHIREGRTLPLFTTATGRVFLAYKPKDILEPILRREIEAFKKGSPGQPRASMKLAEAMRREVLETGFGRMRGEENPGLAALAAPVFDHRGEIVMALTLISILGTFDDSYDSEVAQKLQNAADQLSRRLGYQREGQHPDLGKFARNTTKTAAE